MRYVSALVCCVVALAWLAVPAHAQGPQAAEPVVRVTATIAAFRKAGNRGPRMHPITIDVPSDGLPADPSSQTGGPVEEPAVVP